MRNSSIKIFTYGFLICLLFSVLVRCSDNEVNPIPSGQGRVNFNLTDAPLDATNVEAVFITVNKIEVNGPKGWVDINFQGPLVINLLDYQNGLSTQLSAVNLDTGRYTEIRMILNAAEQGKEKANEGCYIKFKDGQNVGMFVPSGAQSGYKLQGEFIVKSQSQISVTLDFDVRKSVHKAGNSGKYMLKPVVRFVVNNNSGTVKGTFADYVFYDRATVFAYRQGTFTAEEEVENDEHARFANAVNNGVVDVDGNYTIAFLPEGTYDLYLAVFGSDGSYQGIIDLKEGIAVQREQETIVAF
jgi:hypothetical protein